MSISVSTMIKMCKKGLNPIYYENGYIYNAVLYDEDRFT